MDLFVRVDSENNALRIGLLFAKWARANGVSVKR